MPETYLGFPVRLPEVFRIFHLEFDTEKYESGNMSFREEEKYIKNAEAYFKEKSTNFGIYSTDKDQYIVGYMIPEFRDLWSNFCGVSKAMVLLAKLQEQFAEDLRKCKADVTSITLERMEGEPQTVSSPEPFVMTY